MRASSTAYSPDEKQGVNIAEPLSVRFAVRFGFGDVGRCRRLKDYSAAYGALAMDSLVLSVRNCSVVLAAHFPSM